MPDVDVLAVLVATAVAFVLGATYYGVLGEQLARVSDVAAASRQPPPWRIAAEVARCLILVVVVAGLASRAEVHAWTGGLALGVALWIGFPFVLWTGAIVHEDTPWGLAAIHAGDWLVKLLVV